MTRRQFLLLLLPLLMACKDDLSFAHAQDCSAATSSVAAFILKCAEAANPMSDEEGEDLVRQCETTARNTYCHPVAGFRYWQQVEEVPCSQAKTPAEKAFCAPYLEESP